MILALQSGNYNNFEMVRAASSSVLLGANTGKTSHYSVDQILSERSVEDFRRRKTRLVCTMGPACWDLQTLVTMINEGMTVARFNFSHGDHKTHAETCSRVREAAKICGKRVGILLDTKGPEIRTGFFKEGGTISVEAGQTVKLVTDYSFKGDSTCFAVTYDKLPTSVSPGSMILCADGSLSLRVTEVGADFVITEAMNSAVIGERKNMNLPNVKVDLPVCGPKEIDDVQNWGIPNKCDFVAASFVQCAQDVHDFRAALGEYAGQVGIIPKIENVEGIKNFDEILEAADGIMIARGDLGMEIPPEKVFLAQKRMIAKCNLAGKPVITATQMLESMVKAPRPTRAEASDVANAVLDGTDAVMLSGESAGGQFPINAVKAMTSTCFEAEMCIDYDSLFAAIRSSVSRPISVPEAVCASAVETAIDVAARLIVVLTETGSCAKFVSKYRPSQPIVALTRHEKTAGLLSLSRGVIPFVMPETAQCHDDVVLAGLADAKSAGLVKAGDVVVVVHGVQESVAGKTNMVKVITCM